MINDNYLFSILFVGEFFNSYVPIVKTMRRRYSQVVTIVLSGYEYGPIHRNAVVSTMIVIALIITPTIIAFTIGSQYDHNSCHVNILQCTRLFCLQVIVSVISEYNEIIIDHNPLTISGTIC